MSRIDSPRKGIIVGCVAALFCLLAPVNILADADTCLMCHDDASLTGADGKRVGVEAKVFKASVHGGLDCIDCHAQTANYDDVPHFARYVPVDCSNCHNAATTSFTLNFHARAARQGNTRAPSCADCHGVDANPHAMRALTSRTAESACRHCHVQESQLYDTSVHAVVEKGGRERAGCITCHQSHGAGLPPSSGGVNSLCENCHPGAMADVQRGGHMSGGEGTSETLNCGSCHEVHATHKPHLSPRVAQACVNCHQKEQESFKGSVHEQLLASGNMHCLSCHSTHKDEVAAQQYDAGCGSCHQDVEAIYRGSVHRFGRLRGDDGAATCASCHHGHHVLPAGDPASPTNRVNIPGTCGKCHTGQSIVTNEFVRLPITLPNYLKSVHGMGLREGDLTATCTDCHGTHALQTAQDPNSQINRFHIAETCGKCHDEIARQYENSIHGKAVQVGIADSPTCVDCHDEHLIKDVKDPTARQSPEHIARELCGDCHNRPDMVSKYGITAGVVSSYLDSYHGWAISRGGTLVATCVDCHTTHEIRAPQDPKSSVFVDNVTATCSRCHGNANETFARSYTHASALAVRGPHGWAKLIYIVLIVVVLGGMALHNLVVARFELIRHRVRRRREAYVVRWQRAERFQHLVLLSSFFGLAITGFALRMHDAWWVKVIGLGGDEALRADLHRGLAVILTGAAVFHTFWVLFTRRGRYAIREMAPGAHDFVHFYRNMVFHLGFSAERPRFRRFDYTQKAEYWAVVWGTMVMALTGLVLWFPVLVTNWTPAWVVRVAEVVHYYEAILAVSAIFIWHFFYVIFMPSEYPVSTVWLDGRMPAHDWKEFHAAEHDKEGDAVIHEPGPSTDLPGVAVFVPKALRGKLPPEGKDD